MGTIELLVEQVAAGGDGLAREDSGRVVFVHGALPGERVRAHLLEERTDYARATVAEVVTPSPSRRTAPCPFLAAGCGGCTWQHVTEEAQLDLKRAIVAEALRRTGGITNAEVVSGPPLAPFGFRTTLRLGVDAEGRPGFRAYRRRDLVPVDACLVAHPLLADLLATARFPGAHEVTLRAGARTGERLVLVDPPRAASAAVLPPDVTVGWRAHYHEVVAGARLRISARSFFQTRADGAEALVTAVRDAAGDALAGERVVDAYAGVGLFGATLPIPGEVVAVESSRDACSDARHNLVDRPGLTRIVHTTVERWAPEPAALVIADPARRGLGRGAARVLAATGAPRLVLVSCDPVALARDARLLAGHGYEHVRSTVIDLFPQTPRVEVVTRFDRR